MLRLRDARGATLFYLVSGVHQLFDKLCLGVISRAVNSFKVVTTVRKVPAINDKKMALAEAGKCQGEVDQLPANSSGRVAPSRSIYCAPIDAFKLVTDMPR